MKEEDLIYAASMLTSKVINLVGRKAPFDFKSILVVKLDEIGDMANTVHVFALLKKEYPEARITLWCKPFIKSLLENDPHIDRIIHTASELRKHYDLIADLRGNWESIRYALSHIPQYRVDRGTVRLRNKMNGGHPHEVITNLQIIAPVLKEVPEKPELKLYFSETQLEKADLFIVKNHLQKYAVFHCGARRVLRQWKLNNFASLAEYLKKQKGMDIVFTGDRQDIKDIEEVRASLSFPSYSIAGIFSLSEYAALVSKAALFVGNESGPLHIAAAAQIPVVGLFGPGVPVTFYPWGEKAAYVHHVLDCNPCDQIHCVRPDYTCMDMITIAEVVEKINNLV
jgi:ADP-heptose:LPS heptosyltransferase